MSRRNSCSTDLVEDGVQIHHQRRSQKRNGLSLYWNSHHVGRQGEQQQRRQPSLLSCCILSVAVVLFSGMMIRGVDAAAAGGGANGNEKKQIYFLAGPHFTGTNSINNFFLDRASNYNDGGSGGGHDKHESFEHWNWPNIITDNNKVKNTIAADHIQPWNAFDLLVTHPLDDTLQTKIGKTISDTYHEDSEKGIIVGSAMLERVGIQSSTPYTKYQAISAINRVKNKINNNQKKPNDKLENNQINVVINYRTPRVQQWLTLWKITTNGNENLGDADYTPFICSSKDSNDYNLLLELLMTAMNPMFLALTYLEEGYNVVVIDLGGVKEAAKELPHLIACDVIGVPCNAKGKVNGLWNVKPKLNATNDIVPEVLSDHHMEEIELLFRYRDCIYQHYIVEKLLQDQENHPFKVIEQDTLWQDCDSTQTALYNAMVGNPVDLFNRIRAQMDCNDDEIISESDYTSGKVDIPDLPANMLHSSSPGSSGGGGGGGGGSGGGFGGGGGTGGGGGNNGASHHNNNSGSSMTNNNDSIWKGDSGNNGGGGGDSSNMWKGESNNNGQDNTSSSSGHQSGSSGGANTNHDDNEAHNSGKVNEEEEDSSLAWMDEESLVDIGPKPTNKSLGAVIEIPMFLLVTILAGIIQYIRLERERRKVETDQLLQRRFERKQQQDQLHFEGTKPPSAALGRGGVGAGGRRPTTPGSASTSARRQRRRRYQDKLHTQQQQQQQQPEEVSRTNDEYGDDGGDDDDGLDFLQAYGSTPV